MRLISLDLLMGAPRLQRRIDGEIALLQRDLTVARANTRQMHEGVVRKATSLPALAAAAAGGFVIAKIARAPRRRVDVDAESAPSAATAALNASTSLAWQFLMPLAISWVQARFAPQEHNEEPEDLTTKP